MTFWVFAFLSVLTFVLLIFPWRTFFFLSSLILLGPQNIAVRKYLERRANRREQEEKEEKEREALKAQLKLNDALVQSQSQLQQVGGSTTADNTKKEDKVGKKKRLWGRNRKKEDETEQQEDEIKEAEMFHSPRPAFYAHSKPSKRTQVPRDVAIPYFRFRKDRFYDWPPDPTVSRATPMVIATRFNDDEGGNQHDDNMMHTRARVGMQYQGINERSGLRNRGRAPREMYSQDQNDYEYG